MRAEPQVQCAPRSTNVGAVCACAQAWNGRDRPNKRLPTAAVTGGGPPASQHRGGQEDFDVVCQRGPTVSVHSRGRCVGRFVLLGGRVLVRAGFACCHTMRAEPQVQCAPRSTNVGAVCACAQAWNGRDRPNKRLPTAAVTGGGPPASQHRGGQEDFDVVCQRGPTVSVHSRGRCSAPRCSAATASTIKRSARRSRPTRNGSCWP
ncbi:hypothetical protein X194_01018 [Mycobacterium tuberculosis BTB11-236]|nr:hypothetical protein X194_01018 [Mycobacterium tuberculosis BTB11-236]